MPEQRAQERQKQAGQSSGVFQHDREKARIFGLLDELERLRVAARSVELSQRNRKRHALDDGRYADDDVVERRVAERRFRRDFHNAVNTLVNRHATAKREDHDRHDERPEIQFHAVAERMSKVRTALGAFHAKQDEQSVARVNNRVDAF